MSCRDDVWGDDLDCRPWNGEHFELYDAAALYADPRRHSFVVPPALVKEALDKLGD